MAEKNFDENTSQTAAEQQPHSETVLSSPELTKFRPPADLAALRRHLEAAGAAVNETVPAEIEAANIELVKIALQALENNIKVATWSQKEALRNVKPSALNLSHLSSDLFLFNWAAMHQFIGKVRFGELLPYFWGVESNKVIMSQVPEANTWPEQNMIVNKGLNGEAGSFVLAAEFVSESELGRPLTENDLSQERLSDINPIQTMAELIRQTIQELTLQRLPFTKPGSDEVLTLPDQGTTFMAMPKQDIYYVAVHSGGRFKKIALPADVVSMSQTHQLYEILKKELSQPDQWFDNNNHEFFSDGMLDYEDYQGKASTQEMYAKLRTNLSDDRCADMAIVLTSDRATTIDQTQRNRAAFTHGVGVPVVFELGWQKDRRGRFSLRKVNLKCSHPWHDGRPAFERLVRKNVIHKALLQTVRESYTKENIRDDLFDPVAAAYVSREQLTQEEAPVLTVKLPRHQEMLNEIFAGYRLNTPERKQLAETNWQFKALSNVNLHSLLTMTIMIALDQNWVHFLEADEKTGALAPAIAVLPDFVRQRLLNPKVTELSPVDYTTMLRCIQLLADERQQARVGQSTAQIMGVASGGTISPISRQIVQTMGGIFDPGRTNLLTDSVLISMLVSARGSDYEKFGIKNAGFTSALSDVYQRLTVGVIDTNVDEMTITVRRKQAADLDITEAELQARISAIWEKLLRAFVPHTNHLAESI